MTEDEKTRQEKTAGMTEEQIAADCKMFIMNYEEIIAFEGELAFKLKKEIFLRAQRERLSEVIIPKMEDELKQARKILDEQQRRLSEAIFPDGRPDLDTVVHMHEVAGEYVRDFDKQNDKKE